MKYCNIPNEVTVVLSGVKRIDNYNDGKIILDNNRDRTVQEIVWSTQIDSANNIVKPRILKLKNKGFKISIHDIYKDEHEELKCSLLIRQGEEEFILEICKDAYLEIIKEFNIHKGYIVNSSVFGLKDNNICIIHNGCDTESTNNECKHLEGLTGEIYSDGTNNGILIKNVYKRYVRHTISDVNNSIILENLLRTSSEYSSDIWLNIRDIKYSLNITGKVKLSDVKKIILNKTGKEYAELCNKLRNSNLSIEHTSISIINMLNSYCLTDYKEIKDTDGLIYKSSDTNIIIDMDVKEYIRCLVNDMCDKLNYLYKTYGKRVIAYSINYIPLMLVGVDREEWKRNKSIRLISSRLDSYIEELGSQIKSTNNRFKINNDVLELIDEQYVNSKHSTNKILSMI